MTIIFQVVAVVLFGMAGIILLSMWMVRKDEDMSTQVMLILAVITTVLMVAGYLLWVG